MSKAEELITQIVCADECEIMEFDFDPIFVYLMELESALQEIADNPCIELVTRKIAQKALNNEEPTT